MASSGINKVILVGRLGKDPEVRYTPSGAAVANFSIATSESWKDKNTGEKVERTEWHRIIAWNKLGEICGQYLSKGRQVYIEGKMQTRSWDDKEGVTRYITEIVANDVQFLGDKNGGGGGGYNPPAPGDSDLPPGSEMPGKDDDDIPF